MVTLTPKIITILAVPVGFQMTGLSLMPITKGLTELAPSIWRGIAFLVGLDIMLRWLHSGIDLDTFLPVMAAIAPLWAIALVIVFYGESVSLIKLSLVVSANAVSDFASGIA